MELPTQSSLELEKNNDPRGKSAMQPLTLAFAAFAATFPLYSPNMNVFHGFLQGKILLGYFVFPMMVSTFICSCMAIFYSVKHRDWQCFSLNTLGVSTGFYIGGMISFFVTLQLPVSIPLLAFLEGVCVGFALIPLCVTWGTHFAMPLKNAFFGGRQSAQLHLFSVGLFRLSREKFFGLCTPQL